MCQLVLPSSRAKPSQLPLKWLDSSLEPALAGSLRASKAGSARLGSARAWLGSARWLDEPVIQIGSVTILVQIKINVLY